MHNNQVVHINDIGMYQKTLIDLIFYFLKSYTTDTTSYPNNNTLYVKNFPLIT